MLLLWWSHQCVYTIPPPPSAEHADHIHLNPQHASNPLELDAQLLLGLGALMLICLLTHMHENSLRELRSLLALGIRHAGICICKCENSAQYSFAWMHDRYEGVWCTTCVQLWFWTWVAVLAVIISAYMTAPDLGY